MAFSIAAFTFRGSGAAVGRGRGAGGGADGGEATGGVGGVAGGVRVPRAARNPSFGACAPGVVPRWYMTVTSRPSSRSFRTSVLSSRKKASKAALIASRSAPCG